MPFPGDREYQVSLSYFEDGKLRGFETPVWANSIGIAVGAAERILRATHPKAVMHRVVAHDIEHNKMAKPVLFKPKPPTLRIT